MNTYETAPTENSPASPSAPWQVWTVVILLGLEGVGNLLAISNNAAALGWLIAKLVFIVGLLKGWLGIYFAFLFFAIIHVVYFATINIPVALVNLVMIVLLYFARAYFFRPAANAN